MLPALAVFAVFLIWIAYLAFFQCFYNWDMLAYAAVAMEWSGTPDVHDATYQAFQSQVPESEMQKLTASGYSERMAEDPEAFLSQLAFYSVKPGYVGLLAGLHRLGVPIVTAIQAVSALSVMLASALVLVWLRRFLSPIAAVVLTVALAYASRLVDLARVGTPDALSVLVVLTALFLILERQLRVGGALMLLLAVSVRTNNVIFFVLAIGYLALRSSAPLRNRLVAVLGGGVALYALISASGHNWWTLFHHTFIQPIFDVGQFRTPFSWSLYGRVLASAGRELLVRDIMISSVLWFFVVLAVLLLLHRPSLGPWLGLVAINLAALFVLFPLIGNWDRFLVPFYLWIAVALIGSIQPARRGIGEDRCA